MLLTHTISTHAVDQAREERARLQGEITSLKQRLAEAEAANEEVDQVRVCVLCLLALRERAG